MATRSELYFKNDKEWRIWLEKNHAASDGIYLIFYRVDSEFESMRWEEAVQVALCFGWIDSTVKKLDDKRRRQLFTPRKTKSGWSKLNKTYIKKLTAQGLMHESGLTRVAIAKKNGSWIALDAVENLIVPEDLQNAFDSCPIAFENYKNFSMHYRKSYLYWLNMAKREETRNNRIQEIINLCEKNIKTRQ